MSDTPRTSKMIAYAPIGLKINPAFNQAFYLCEQLEIELNAANERIKQLEESENRMLNWLTEDCPEAVKKQLSNAWMKSKEAKP